MQARDAPDVAPVLLALYFRRISVLEILEDVSCINDDGLERHPFKGVKGDKKGFFSYTLSSDNTTFKPATEARLRELIEDGEFNNKGRIRMAPKGL